MDALLDNIAPFSTQPKPYNNHPYIYIQQKQAVELKVVILINLKFYFSYKVIYKIYKVSRKY